MNESNSHSFLEHDRFLTKFDSDFQFRVEHANSLNTIEKDVVLFTRILPPLNIGPQYTPANPSVCSPDTRRGTPQNIGPQYTPANPSVCSPDTRRGTPKNIGPQYTPANPSVCSPDTRRGTPKKAGS